VDERVDVVLVVHEAGEELLAGDVSLGGVVDGVKALEGEGLVGVVHVIGGPGRVGEEEVYNRREGNGWDALWC